MTIEVKNTPNQIIDVSAKNINQEIDVKQETILVPVYKDVPEYEGGYTVTPKVVEQTMETRNKV